MKRFLFSRKRFSVFTQKNNHPIGWLLLCWHLPIVPGRCQPSIVGTSELNFCVRNGNRWTLTVINTNYSTSVVVLVCLPATLI